MGRIIDRRRVMGGNKLPYDAEIEYLEGTGTQYIDTLLVINGKNYIIEGDITTRSLGNQQYYRVFGNHSTEFPNEVSLYRLQFNLSTGNGAWCCGGAVNGERSHYALKTNTRYFFTIYGEDSHITLNDTNYSYPYAKPTRDNTESIKIFTANSAQNRSNFDIRSFKVYCTTSSHYILDLIPVVKDNIGYMYDKVSGQLFGNAGTGEFILGPDVSN